VLEPVVFDLSHDRSSLDQTHDELKQPDQDLVNNITLGEPTKNEDAAHNRIGGAPTW